MVRVVIELNYQLRPKLSAVTQDEVYALLRDTAKVQLPVSCPRLKHHDVGQPNQGENGPACGRCYAEHVEDIVLRPGE